MLRISCAFLLFGVIAWFAADLEIQTKSPEQELAKLLDGLLSPALPHWDEFGNSIIYTLTIALSAVGISAFFGALLAPFYHKKLVRTLCTFARSIHEIFWALLLIPLFRLTPFCGVIALVIPFSGIFAKIFREISDESDRSGRQAIPPETSRLSYFLYSVFPTIAPGCWKYISYRLECGLRSSAVLGFLGIPTVGFHLESFFGEGFYSEAAGILYCFFILVAIVRLSMKWFIALPACLVSTWIIAKTFSISSSILSFFTELLPWPLRGQQSWLDWLQLILDSALVGVLNTIVLSILAIVAIGIGSILLFPLVARVFSINVVRVFFEGIFLISRTIPELFLAYVFLILLGPSMLPALIALVIHNVAILAHLTASWADEHHPEKDFSTSGSNVYLFWTVPKIYGQFLSYLFYRWEVVIRESALFGILGLYTIGFYIDKAIHEDQLDVAVVLILLSGTLTLFVDFLSRTTRQYLQKDGVTHHALVQ